MAGFRSKAVSSKGTAVFIGTTGAGTPGTISGITQANPAVVTITGHPFVEGDVVKIAGVVGMTEINGVEAIVQNPATNTVELHGVDSAAFTAWASGGTATPVPFLQFCELKDFAINGAAAPTIEVTTMCSDAVEKVQGLADTGEISFSFNLVPTDPAYKEMVNANADSIKRWWKIVYPAAAGAIVEVLQASVKQLSKSFGVGSALTGNGTGDISGPTVVLTTP